MHFIKHLRGTRNDWKLHNAVIPDGEIALVKEASGFYSIRVGNGKNKITDLPDQSGKAIVSQERNICLTIQKDIEYRFSELDYLEIANFEVLEDNFISEVTFDSPTTPTTVKYAMKYILFSGNSVKKNVFVPEPNTHYNLFFFYDGRMNCQVRGVKLV